MKTLRYLCIFLACAPVVAAADVDPHYAPLAAQLFATDEEIARTTLLDANPSLAGIPLVRTMNALAGKVYDRHDFENSLKLYGIVCSVATHLGDRLGLGNCTFDAGLSLSHLNQQEDALAKFHSAIAIYESLEAHEELARVLNSEAILYYRRGDNNSALPCLIRAMTEAEKSGNPIPVAQTNTNLSNVYKALGRYREGIQTLQKALEVARSRPSLAAQTAIIMNNLGGLYFDQRDIDLALSYHTQALALKEKLQVNPADLASSVLNVGVDNKELGNYERAATFFNRTLDITEKGNNLLVRELALFNYGILLHTLGRNAEARAKLEAAISLSDRISDRGGAAQARIELAEIAADESHPADALAFARPALEYGNLQRDPKIIVRAQEVIGVALAKQGQVDEADSAFREGISVVERMRDQLPADRQMVARYFDSQVSIYQHMVDLQVKRHRPDLAFAWAETSKGRALLDALRTGRTDIARSLTAAERAEENRLAGAITSVNEQILRESRADTPDRKRITELGSDLESARNQYEGFLVTLYATHPRLKVQRVAFDPVTPAAIVASLPDRNSALLEFSLTDSGGYLFVITANSQGGAELKLYPLSTPRKDLEHDVTQFRDRIASRDLDYRALALSLYRRLLAPAEGQLRGKSTLVIVPDGGLWRLPFQALQPDPSRYLIEDHAIFYAPSLSVLYEIRKLRRPVQKPQRRLLALDAALVPAARREVEGLREVYGAGNVTIFSGPEAEETLLKREAPKYQVLHLAAHGVFEDHNPMDSYLVLAKAGKPEAGVFEARRMMDLDLRADMVVLSGCETGRGAAASEGLLGMSWALFIAGSPSTVASQWKVESNSTSDLMLDFHRNVQHEGKAAALRQAELAVMKNPEYRHPFYWSSFVLVGQGF